MEFQIQILLCNVDMHSDELGNEISRQSNDIQSGENSNSS